MQRLQKCMPGASSSCSSWLRAALQNSLFREVCEVGAASGQAQGRVALPGTGAPTPQCHRCPCSATAGNEPGHGSPACEQVAGSRSQGLLLECWAISHAGHATGVTARSVPGDAGCLIVGLPLQARLGKRVEGQGFVQDADRKF